MVVMVCGTTLQSYKASSSPSSTDQYHLLQFVTQKVLNKHLSLQMKFYVQYDNYTIHKGI